jgi:hypothetical protein
MKRTSWAVRWVGLWAAGVCLWTTGCAELPRVVEQEAPEQFPSYEELVDRYNRNLDGVDRLWARAVVELEWEDEKGGHFEQGEGHLIVVLPDRVALSLGKLGKTMFWAGSDGQRYWLFDTRDDKSKLYVGRNDHPVDLDENGRRVGFPIRPPELLKMLGIARIEPGVGAGGAVGWREGCYVIEPPGTSLRFHLDPQTARPRRIDLVDSQGNELVTARLSGWETMTLSGVGPGAYPRVATRFEVVEPARHGTMTLFLSGVTDGKDEGRITSKVFDLQKLREVFKPREIVDLDAPVERAMVTP